MTTGTASDEMQAAPAPIVLEPWRSTQSREPKRVLFISYQFPPVGGAGVQRVAKFVKYLPHFGWQPSVLTVSNPSVPVFDDSLTTDIPASVPIYRAPTWEPAYSVKSQLLPPAAAGSVTATLRRLGKGLIMAALQPDPQVLWLPGALRAGWRLLRDVPHSAIVVSGPPFSMFLSGAVLSSLSGLPLLLDYRDEWDLSTAYLENRQSSWFSRWLQQKMQAFAVRKAGTLIATTRNSALALAAIKEKAHSRSHITWIYNGYDHEDFATAPSAHATDRDRHRLVYVGTLWNLTDVGPLVEAVRRLGAERPELAGRLELTFLGRRTDPQEKRLNELEASACRIRRHSYVDHANAVGAIRAADTLCLLLSDLPGAHRVVPAKLFEYLASGRPLLIIAPRGEVWEIVKDYPQANCFEPHDQQGIVGFLAQQIMRGQQPGQRQACAGVSRYSRKQLTAQLAACLDDVTC